MKKTLKSFIFHSTLNGIILKGLSNYLNFREPFLDSDFTQSTSLPVIYDTDLENFWTQKSILLDTLK